MQNGGKTEYLREFYKEALRLKELECGEWRSEVHGAQEPTAMAGLKRQSSLRSWPVLCRVLAPFLPTFTMGTLT